MAETSKAGRSASTSEGSVQGGAQPANESASSRSSSSSSEATGSDREVLSPVGVESNESDWQLDVEAAKQVATAGGQLRPGMSMMDIQGSAFDIPEVFDEYKYYENERVNNAAHLRHRFDQRQIDWDLTSRRDLDDDGVTSTGVKIRENSSFAKSRKSDQDR